MRKPALACTLLLFLAACGGGGSGPTPTAPAPIPSTDTCGVIGGSASTAGPPILNGAPCAAENSSVVLLNMRSTDGNGLGACTGTIVATRVILTAAHCLDEGVGVVSVWLGPPTVPVDAESFTFYPNYRFNVPDLFDVGVVVMAQNLPRRPFALLTSREGRVGETAVLVGWGRDQGDVPATLRAGSTTLSSVSTTFLQTRFAPPSSSICAGDSGGPILLQEGGTWAIAGITSATSTSACNERENFFQAVRHVPVRDFIRQHVPGLAER